jgi:hypothetical protein
VGLSVELAVDRRELGGCLTPPVEVEIVRALFTRPSWRRAQALLCSGLLEPTNCVLTAALRVLGLSKDKYFQNYHRVLTATPGREGRCVSN